MGKGKRKYKRSAIILLLVSFILLLGMTGCAYVAVQEEMGEVSLPENQEEENSGDSLESGDSMKEETPEGVEALQDGVSTEGKSEEGEKDEKEGEADTAEAASSGYSCTISIICDTILDNMEDLADGKEDILPEDGIIFPETEVSFTEGDSVFDVLLSVTKSNKIHMEFVSTPMYDSSYIEGIANIYEFDCGNLSGWEYKVNGEFPRIGCNLYKLCDKDVIEVLYTCDFGRDIGGNFI